MLEMESHYFNENREELINLYKGKFIVIVNSEVVGVFENREEAVFSAEREFEPGSFLLKKCVPEVLDVNKELISDQLESN